MFRLSTSFPLVLLCWLATTQSLVAAATDYTSHAEAAYVALQGYYTNSTGLWIPSTGWWNSANCMTVLGDLAAVDSSVQSNVSAVFANTFVQAQKYNLQMTKVVQADFNYETIYGPTTTSNVNLASNESTSAINPKGFLNGFYDDEGWWALGWIQAYDVTKNQDYLTMASDIFEDMKNGSTTPCGGIWWDKAHTYVNSIANELYFSVGAHLANRMTNKQYYVDLATNQLNFLQSSGLQNSKGLFNDGLTKTCKNNNGTIWSYNQGVVLGGLVELNTAAANSTTPANSTYLTMASKIASAAMAQLGPDGVLHESCEPNCGGDGTQFKGIFMRNLQLLQKASPNDDVLQFIGTNAASIWNTDRNSNNQLGVVWSGFTLAPNASTQSSAMDALVAAAAFQSDLQNAIIS